MKATISAAAAALLLGLLAPRPSQAARPVIDVAIGLPGGAVASGSKIQVPVMLTDADEHVVSYAFRLKFDPAVLRIEKIDGGTADGFTDAPIANPLTFASGETVFTANNSGFQSTPGTAFSVAVITFEVIGPPGSRGRLTVRRARLADVTLAGTFERANRVRFRDAKGRVAVH